MALTLSLLGDDGEPLDAASLTLDAPRIVVGRSKSCEVLLLDPSVSKRHATIRREGGRNLIIDEGSTNGVRVDDERLSPRTPRLIQDGEVVRIGRVWLRLSLAAKIPSPSGSRERFALALLRHEREKDGEPLHAELRVVAGPDDGASLALRDYQRDYRVGRSREADLVLKDELASRFHALVSRRGEHWQVHDNGSKRGTQLDDEKLDEHPLSWPSDALLKLGNTAIALIDPLPAARAEALAAPDLPMRSEEHEQPAPGRSLQPTPAHEEKEAEEQEEQEETAPDTATPTPAHSAPLEVLRDPKGAGYLSIDLLVVLVSLGVIVISMAALWWVLG